MTTPENFRRRQRVEGTALIVLGLWIAFWTYHSSERDEDIVQCLENKVTALGATSSARGGLVELETEATRKVIQGSNEVKSQREFDQLIKDFNASIRSIQQIRKATPVPPYPAGSCDAQ